METNERKRINLLPDVIDNQYHGMKIAKYAFWIIMAASIVRSLIHVLAADGGAQTIATIPLDSYPSAAAAAVILMFSYWGLSQLLMGFIYLGVALKYQSLIPTMYVLLIFEYAMRFIIGQAKPIVTTGTAPGSVGNWIMVPVCIVLLVLSLMKDKTKTAEEVKQS